MLVELNPPTLVHRSTPLPLPTADAREREPRCIDGTEVEIRQGASQASPPLPTLFPAVPQPDAAPSPVLPSPSLLSRPDEDEGEESAPDRATDRCRAKVDDRQRNGRWRWNGRNLRRRPCNLRQTCRTDPAARARGDERNPCHDGAAAITPVPAPGAFLEGRARDRLWLGWGVEFETMGWLKRGPEAGRVWSAGQADRL